MRTIKHGETIPVGFSKKVENSDCNARWMLRLPLLHWKRRGYDVCNDEFFTGVWRFSVFFSFDTYYTGIGIRMMYGWERLPSMTYV